ncbi:hypothetical protein PR002_g32199 [Phytophthora rubi]|uniref:Uncharacterized protein n=1 Tax=Phytophthora rubi TaxID=129364 RepID=A0A6A3GC24_9STRA|nr:hypothetical protein PR002_g32199 [Phytophthora rubi]
MRQYPAASLVCAVSSTVYKVQGETLNSMVEDGEDGEDDEDGEDGEGSEDGEDGEGGDGRLQGKR